MVFQVLGDLSIANSALFPCLSVGEGPEHEVEGPFIPDICLFYSTSTIFGSTFLHTKARESRQNRFRDKTA